MQQGRQILHESSKGGKKVPREVNTQNMKFGPMCGCKGLTLLSFYELGLFKILKVVKNSPIFQKKCR